MSAVTKPMTWQEFSAINDASSRHELLRGEVVTMPMPHTDHGYYASNIFGPLFLHVKEQKLGVVLGESGFLLTTDPDTVLGPDVSFIRVDRLAEGRLPKGAYFRGAPDFLVEVLSTTDTVAHTEDKIDAWLTAGARLVWLVNPRRQTVTVYRPAQPPQFFNASQVLDASDVVAGFTMPVAQIFA